MLSSFIDEQALGRAFEAYGSQVTIVTDCLV
jgi:hypothetical protein